MLLHMRLPLKDRDVRLSHPTSVPVKRPAIESHGLEIEPVTIFPVKTSRCATELATSLHIRLSVATIAPRRVVAKVDLLPRPAAAPRRNSGTLYATQRANSRAVPSGSNRSRNETNDGDLESATFGRGQAPVAIRAVRFTEQTSR
jgi:hypothetical protein